MYSVEGLDKIFKPRSIAIIGATDRKGTIGRELTHNLISYGFRGMVFPVNPKADVIHSVKCYRSVSEIPDPVDLAIIMVRKDLVLGVVEECGQKGVGGLTVITSGFKEIGPEGAKRELSRAETAPKSCSSEIAGGPASVTAPFPFPLKLNSNPLKNTRQPSSTASGFCRYC